jgi:hypothetical protein
MLRRVESKLHKSGPTDKEIKVAEYVRDEPRTGRPKVPQQDETTMKRILGSQFVIT